MKIFLRNPRSENFNFLGHKISHMNYDKFLKYNKTFGNYLKHGISGNSLFAKLLNPSFIQNLYISKDKSYFKFLNEFKERFEDYDVIVMNPGVDLVHPEFLHKHFKNSLKVLHFTDDPHQTYNYGLAYSWVFDAATYISPSYSEDIDMEKLLSLAGFKSTFWVPSTLANINPPKWTVAELENQLRTRKKQVVYFGNFYTNKIDRLITLKKNLKNNFKIYGKFPLKGFAFFVYSLLKKKPVIYLPKYLSSDEERDKIYEKIAIGINMHYSHPAIETGNTRTYELPYNGVAQIVDISKVSLINKIFEPNKEILTYESIDECIYQAKRLIEDDDLRCKIALAGYKKAIKEYSYDQTLKNIINWFEKLTH
jgi:hypothetical protein